MFHKLIIFTCYAVKPMLQNAGCLIAKRLKALIIRYACHCSIAFKYDDVVQHQQYSRNKSLTEPVYLRNTHDMETASENPALSNNESCNFSSHVVEQKRLCQLETR